MSKIIIVEPNTSDKDQVRAYLVKGEKGYSAYDLYVQNGGTLTEEEWLDEFLNAENFYNKSETDNLLDDKVNKTDIVDNVISTNIDKPLSANQGKELKDLIDDTYTKSETDNLLDDKADASNLLNYKLIGDFAVITGTIECTTTTGYNSKNIDYPTGFTKDNCAVISFGAGGQAFNFGYAGLGFGYSYTSANTGMLGGSQDRYIVFYDNHMTVTFYNSSSSTFTYAYQIVLMKIS